jgi:hypothetical protein
MINLGQIDFDNLASIGQPLVLKATNSLNAIGTVATGPIFPLFTVETLPAATAALKGSVVYVSDATTPALGTALVGGGVVFCLALCTGAAWVAA